MRALKNILLFQRKIAVISYLISIVIVLFLLGSLEEDFSLIFTASKAHLIPLEAIGFSLMFIAPLVHFFTYETKNKNEYYYYYNLGFNRFKLWCSTFAFGFINLIIFLFI